MTRLRHGGFTYDREAGAVIDLMMGPTDAPGELTIDQLETAWEFERREVMESCRRNPNPGWRPWAFWQFELREPKPDGRVAEGVRLAELSELWPEELAALEQRAKDARESWAWKHAGQYPGVHRPREAVEMWDAVQAALERR